MQFRLETPALIFPAISLLMLAYTNRFVVLAGLIRDLDDRHRESPKQQFIAQIENLRIRMIYIQRMQICGALAFIVSAASMFASMVKLHLLSYILFTVGLLFLITSLIYLLLELNISVNALSIQLEDMHDKKKD